MKIPPRVRFNRGIDILQLSAVLIILTTGVGWIMNIVKIIHMMPENISDISGMLLFRGLGVIIAPLGSILGFF